MQATKSARTSTTTVTAVKAIWRWVRVSADDLDMVPPREQLQQRTR